MGDTFWGWMKMETFSFSKAVSKEKLIHGEIEKYYYYSLSIAKL